MFQGSSWDGAPNGNTTVHQRSCRSKRLLSLTQPVPGILQHFPSRDSSFPGILSDYSHSQSFIDSGVPQNSLSPVPAGLCHHLSSPASTTSRLHFPSPSKPLSYTPGLGMNIKLIIKPFLLLIENSLQGVNSRRKKGLL